MSEQHERNLQVCNIGFSALACISFGMILLSGILFTAESNPFSYFTCAAVGATAMVLMYRRIAVHWRAVSAHERAVLVDVVGKSGYSRHLRASLFLAALGYLGAVAAGSGWIAVFIPYVLLTFLFPWSRIALCRRSLGAPLTLLCAGMTVGLAVADRLPHSLVLGAIVWMLWTSAVFAWLRLVLLDRYGPGPTQAIRQHAVEQKIGNEAEMLHNT